MKPFSFAPFLSGILLFISSTVGAQLTEKLVHRWDAVIGKNTVANIWLVAKDSVLIGEIVYKKSGKPIQLRGTFSKNTGYLLYEFDKNGNISGIMHGSFAGSGSSGEWYSPSTKNHFPLSLKLVSRTSPAKAVVLIPNNVSGSYAYQASMDGPVGTLTVSRISADTIQIELECVTAGPAYNLASIEKFNAKIRNNMVQYRVQNGCELLIRFVHDVAVVEYVNGQADCGFGAGADVSGIYMKKAK